MTPSEVEQHVIDALGKILVDKSRIQENENAMLSELVLDEADFKTFFDELHEACNIELPRQIRSDISHSPDDPKYSQLTVQGLVDLILVKMKNRKPER